MYVNFMGKYWKIQYIFYILRAIKNNLNISLVSIIHNRVFVLFFSIKKKNKQNKNFILKTQFLLSIYYIYIKYFFCYFFKFFFHINTDYFIYITIFYIYI